MSLSKKIHLREGERITRIIRRYSLTSLWKYIVGLAFLAVSSFFAFYLFSKGWWGYAVFGSGMLVGLYIICRTWFFNYYNMFIVSTERVVDIHRAGWFDEFVSSVSHKDIKDIGVRKKGLLANVFDYGSLVVEGPGQQHVLEAAKIHRPQEAQAQLGEAREQYLRHRRLADARAVYHNFLKIIPDLSVEELENALVEINKQFDDDNYAEQ